MRAAVHIDPGAKSIIEILASIIAADFYLEHARPLHHDNIYDPITSPLQRILDCRVFLRLGLSLSHHIGTIDSNGFSSLKYCFRSSAI